MKTEWIHVGADPTTVEDAAKLAEDLCDAGFTKAQILRAGLTLGVKAIKADPSVLVSARGRKK